MLSMEMTLNDAKGIEPGCVLIMPRNRVTFHVRTWLYSEHTENILPAYIIIGNVKIHRMIILGSSYYIYTAQNSL